MEYDFKKIETEWQAYWAKHKTFAAKDGGDKPKYYVLDMFPYPSGAGLHVGHPLGYIASDIVSRYKRHKGFNVLHPMGYDSFGLPAEQYAIQTGQHPKITTEQNINVYRRQLDKIGFSFDWNREVRTSNPDYYKWTQWIFIQIFNSWYNKNTNKAENIFILISEFETKGNASINACCDESVKQFTALEWKAFSEKEQSDMLMAYRIAYLGEAYVNWCPQLGTVLANDEIKDGVSERGGYPVERKLMKQWSMRITAYSQRLLDGLDTLDWTESLKEAQRNWIGRSEGTSLKFKILTPSPSPKERGTASQNYLTAKQEIAVELLKQAKANRINYTETEDIIWQALRNRKLDVKFRRQHPIDKFIADFVCLEQHLIVEIDGAYHNNEEQKQLDDARTTILELSGFTVIRFTNNEVLTNLDSVINSIKQCCSSPPSPLERGLGGEDIEVFTTRPDTIFGVSFVTLAPEHELVNALTTPENKATVEAYVTQAKNRSERERQADIAKITGVFTGSYVEHPFTGKQIPIWIGDYVLAGYGTGAVMAVPAHDSRDYSFAKHFGLPILEVVQSPSPLERAGGEVYDAKEGKLINSDFLNGLDVKEAIKKAISEIEANDLGKGKVNFRLRDAVFGRQRYWGEPIPIYYKKGIPYAVEEKHLPLELPEVDVYLPTPDGEPPLARAKDWTYSPLLGRGAGGEDLETTTMPGWAGSSWYFLRYMDAHNVSTFADKKLSDYWKQVDLYIGGSEHATGHLLYVRFWTKFLKDLGYIEIDEPAKKLINQGMIQGRSLKPCIVSNNLFGDNKMYYSLDFINKKCKEIPTVKFKYDLGNNVPVEYTDEKERLYKNKLIELQNKENFYSQIFPIEEIAWQIDEKGEEYILLDAEIEKMSKSKRNVVTPDDIAEKFGADTLRLYEMFLGPLEQSKPWNTNGITGVHGFLKKLWRLFYLSPSGGGAQGAGEAALNISNDEPTKGELKTLHKTIKKITEDIERFSFNTSISNFMICVNELTDAKCNKREILEPLLICLSPYAPHIAEELWKQLGHNESIALAPFPEYNEAYLVDDSINYPISFNGKVKFTLELAATLTKEEVEVMAMAHENMIKFLDGKEPKKVIVVHKKIVNVVV